MIIAANNADWLREKAITSAEEMLQAHEVIDLFFCLNDPMAEGAYIAAKNAGREKTSCLSALTACPPPTAASKALSTDA